MDVLLSFYPTVSALCEKLTVEELKNVSVLSEAWWEITSQMVVNRTMLTISRGHEEEAKRLKRNYQFLKIQWSEKEMKHKKIFIPRSCVHIEFYDILYDKDIEELLSLKHLKHLKINRADVCSKYTMEQLKLGLKSFKMGTGNTFLQNLLTANNETLEEVYIKFKTKNNFLKNQGFRNLRCLKFALTEENATDLEEFLMSHAHLELLKLNVHTHSVNFLSFLEMNSSRTRKLCIKSFLLKNDFFHLNFSNLHSLNLDFSQIISNDKLELFLKNHPNLKILKLYFEEKQSIQFDIFEKQSPKVSMLHLGNFRLHFKRSFTNFESV